MTYILLCWISVSVGFVLGAAWAGLTRKNRELDRRFAAELDEYSPTAQKTGL